MRRLGTALAAVGLLATAACGDVAQAEDTGPNPDANVRVLAPAKGSTVAGDTVTLRVAASGVRIVKPDGDVSGRTADYHVFVDRNPVAPGESIPKLPGITHTPVSPVLLTGLTPGLHQIFVVLGDGAHRRLGKAIAHTSVHVEGPTVQLSGPATAKVGETVTVRLRARSISTW